MNLRRKIPRWAEPLLGPARYKGAKGGRAGGRSHFYAEHAVQAMVADPALRFVCIREVQRSLRYSAKSLVESKIRQWGLEHSDQNPDGFFRILTSEIRHTRGPGVMIFEGMQDHTADSIKSLEGFGRAWVEEAQSLSKRSLDLLIPTIRADDAELWFGWNPDQPGDPVDEFLVQNPPEDAVVVHHNYDDNPFCPRAMHTEAERMRTLDPDAFGHIWLGGYNVKGEAQVLGGHWVVDEFDAAPIWDGPYYGADWGYSQDPAVLTRSWVGEHVNYGAHCLMIEYDERGVGVGLDELADLFRRVPGADDHVIRGDPSRPETIAHLCDRGLRVQAAPSWSGSVEDGILYLRSFDKIIIHPRCKAFADEARLWKYKTDRLTGDPLPKLQKGNDHGPDSVRYAHSPMIRKSNRRTPKVWVR